MKVIVIPISIGMLGGFENKTTSRERLQYRIIKIS